MRSEAVSSPRTGRALLAALTVALGALMLAAFASPAQADTLTVTNTNDSGPGSLRQAIDDAAPSGDTITFAPNVSGTITLTSGEIVIDKSLNIEGPGAGKLAVSGNNSSTVFQIGSWDTVRISGLTITKGYTYNSFSNDGGGISNEGNLTLTGSVVRGNYAEGSGGGILNGGNLTLTGSVVRDNSADSEGGGIGSYDGTLTIMNSTISGNTAGDYGGGILSDNYNNGSRPDTIITNSNISGNSASSGGGGIYSMGYYDRSIIIIRYSTIRNNKAPNGNGSGVYGNGRVDTILKVFSSIISDNKGTDVDFFRNGNDNPFTSEGYNLIGDGNATGAFRATGDRVGVTDPGRIVTGTSGNDTLSGTSGSDIISGLGGNDTIRGLDGGDIIRGGAGNDTVYGGAGSNRLFAGTGVDKLYGGPSADLLNVRDSKPNDLAAGGAGTDTCQADRGDTKRSCER